MKLKPLSGYLALGLSVGLAPFCWSNTLFDPVFAPKLLCFTISLLAFLGGFLVFKDILPFRPTRLLGLSYIQVWFSWFVFQLFSLAWGFSKAEAGFEVFKTGLTIAFLLILTELFIRKPKFISIAAQIVTGALLLAEIGGLLQYFELALTEINGWAGAFPYLTFANPNLFSSWLLLAAPFACYISLSEKGGWRLAGILAVAFALVVMFLAKGRSALGGLLVGGTIAIAVYFLIKPSTFFRFSIPSIVHKRSFLSVFVVSIIVSAAFVWLYPTFYNELVEKAGGKLPLDENSLNQRLYVWNKTALMIQDHPLIGVGAGNWRNEIPTYGTDEYYIRTGVLTFDRPHNDWLWAGAELGLGGMALYFMMLVMPIGLSVNGLAQTSALNKRFLIACILAGFIGYLADSLFNFPRERIETTIYWSLTLACLLAVVYDTNETKSKPAQWLESSTINGLGGAFLGIVIIVGLKFSYERFKMEIAYRKTLAAYEMKNLDLKNKRLANPDPKYDYLLIAKASEGLSKWAPLTPAYIPLEWYRGVAYDAINDIEAANRDFQRSYELAPNHINVLNNLASSYFKLKQPDKAIIYYQKALALYPQHQEVLFNLSAAYFQTGQTQLSYETALKCDRKVKAVDDRLKFLESKLNIRK